MKKRTPITICPNCRSAIPERVRYCPQCGAANRKSQKKKVLPILVCILSLAVIIIALTGIMSGNTRPGYETLDWNTVELSSQAPAPDFNKADVWENSTESFMADFSGLSKEAFERYASACEQDGYTIERQKDSTIFRAFNEAGYNISLNYYEDEQTLYYTLNAPVQMSTLYWPSTGLGAGIPVPPSGYGRITADSQYAFNAYIGNMSLEDFDSYAQQCREAGFDHNYYKYEDVFSGEDEKGNMLSVTYNGNHVVAIDLYAAEN